MMDFKIEHIQVVNSTNTYLKNLIKKSDAIEGTVIMAEFQTSGRGRGDASWISDAAKNITLSVLLKPEIPASQHFSLVEFVSLSLLDTMKHYGLDAQIKWPNDIYIEGKKIAGVLIENTIVKDTITVSVTGIGLNVNQESFPKDLPNPVSLKLLLKKSVNRDEIFARLLGRISFRYDQLKSGSFDQLHNEYRLNIYGMDKKVAFYRNGNLENGILRNISETGEILIESKKGELKGFLFDEIKFV